MLLPLKFCVVNAKNDQVRRPNRLFGTFAFRTSCATVSCAGKRNNSILPVMLFIFLVLSFSGLSAEEAGPAAAVIIFNEGEDFEIIDTAARPVEILDIIGHELYEGDVVITYDDTFLELQVISSPNIIKIAENTDFQLETMEEGKTSNFKMLYGSVRAKVAKLGKGERFRIKGSSAVAGVRGTDFGMNVIVPQTGDSTEAVTQVYCFEGEVEVQTQVEIAGKAVEERVIITADTMVSVSPQEPEKALEIIPIADQIRNYWQENPFKGTPLFQEEAEVVQAPPLQLDLMIAELEKKRKGSLIAGGLFLSLGMLLDAAGGWAIYYSANESGLSNPADWESGGTAMLVSGTFFLTSSIFTLISSAKHKAEIKKLKAGR